jgi:hypothetical protein
VSFDISLHIEPAATAESVRSQLAELGEVARGAPASQIAEAFAVWCPQYEDWEPDGTPGGYATVYDRNYTSNVSPIWRAAGVNLAELDGKAAREVIGPLRDALAAMAADPARFEAMNPENGWGGFDGAFGVILELWIVAMRFPYATLRVGA